MSKKIKIITIISLICLFMVLAIVGVVALIEARARTSFKISYTAKQVNCIVNQKMTQYNANGTIKDNGVTVLEELKFNSATPNKIHETPFPDVELTATSNSEIDYVVYSIVITNTELTDGSGIDISFKLNLDPNCNLDREITTAVGGSLFTESNGIETETGTLYKLGQINAGQSLKVNIKLSVEDVDVDINLVEGSFNFNLERIDL